MDKTLMIVGLCLVAAAAFACGLFIQSRLIRRAIERIFAPVNGAQPKGKETMPHFCPFAQDVLDAVRHELNRKSELEHETAALRERYELVSTNIAASLLIYDRSGKVVFCSPYTQVLTGYSPEEIAAYSADGADFLESLVVEQDAERYKRARQVSQLGEDILVRCRIRHRSGLRLWLETRLVPVCNDDGEVVSVLAVTVDVTDTLNYQEQIEA
ncbi:MAG TPA: PAS domain-containing protein, partial [Oligoflexia bacterium]|nr:PAS domain-containing protein [Oligoflexia bacterium]